jgi:hypothetical protein
MNQEDEMMENGKSRKRRQLSPEEKWEIFRDFSSLGGESEGPGRRVVGLTDAGLWPAIIAR